MRGDLSVLLKAITGNGGADSEVRSRIIAQLVGLRNVLDIDEKIDVPACSRIWTMISVPPASTRAFSGCALKKRIASDRVRGAT